MKTVVRQGRLKHENCIMDDETSILSSDKNLSFATFDTSIVLVVDKALTNYTDDV